MNFISSLIKKPLQKLQKIKQSFEKQINQFQITEIHDRLYHIQYPTQKNISHLISHLKSSQQFQIWNISQYPYQQNILCKIIGQGKRNSDGNQVIFNLTFQLFANIPFSQLIKACQTIQRFLTINESNKVFIHCQDNKRRSAIFLASYTFLTGKQEDIVKSILKINSKLNFCLEDKNTKSQPDNSAKINQEEIYKSQHLVLKNLFNYLNNHEFINKHQLKFLKILINFAPKINSVIKIKPSNLASQPSIKSTNQQCKIPFKILIQIRSQNGLKFRKIFDENVIQGQAICIRFQQSCIISDQFLIIIKYVIDKKAYSVLRSQLNSNFIFNNFCRVRRQDLDLSVQSNFQKNKRMFIDLIFEEQKQLFSQLSQLNIIKESVQKQKKQNKVMMDAQNKIKEQDDDQFNILNEQQQQQRQLRLDRQVEEQLQEQIKKIKSKKSNSKQKQAVNQKEIEKDKFQIKPIKNQGEKRQSLTSILTQEDNQKQNKNGSKDQVQSMKSQKQVQIQNKKQKSNAKQQSTQNVQQISEDDLSQNSQGEQEEQEEQDLEQYLSKLQKQAQKQ